MSTKVQSQPERGSAGNSGMCVAVKAVIAVGASKAEAVVFVKKIDQIKR